MLLVKRPEKGLLAPCWSRRLGRGREDFPSHAKALKQAPFKAEWKKRPGIVRHGFTHFELEIEVYAALELSSPNERTSVAGRWDRVAIRAHADPAWRNTKPVAGPLAHSGCLPGMTGWVASIRRVAHGDAQDRRAWLRSGQTALLVKKVLRAAAGAARRSAPACRSARTARRSSRCRRPAPAHARRSGGSSRWRRRRPACRRRAPWRWWRLRVPCSTVPGGNSPRSTTQPKGMRGSARLDLVTSSASSSAGTISAMRARATSA